MRCSARDRGVLCPSFITSTPLPRRRTQLNFDQSALSPITDAASSVPVFTLPRVSSRTKVSTVKKQKSTFNPLVECSDSDEELVTRRNMPLSRMSSRKEGDLETAKLFGAKQTRSTRVRERPSNFLEEISVGNKKAGGRISRVEAILDEIVKESLRKSNVTSYSPSNVKLKSDESIDAMIEQVMKHRNIVVSTRTRNQPKRGKTISSAVEEKENLVRKIINGSQEVEILRVRQPITQTKLSPPEYKSNEKGVDVPNNTILNNLNNRKRSSPDGYLNLAKKKKIVSPDSICKTFINNSESVPTHDVPVIYKLHELDWQPTKNHEGVSISRTFKSSNTSEGYVKLAAKCFFKKTPSSDQVFVVCEGLGEVKVNNSRTKIGVGDTIRVPSGFPYEFLNRGVKKPLLMSYTFWK